MNLVHKYHIKQYCYQKGYKVTFGDKNISVERDGQKIGYVYVSDFPFSVYDIAFLLGPEFLSFMNY